MNNNTLHNFEIGVVPILEEMFDKKYDRVYIQIGENFDLEMWSYTLSETGDILQKFRTRLAHTSEFDISTVEIILSSLDVYKISRKISPFFQVYLKVVKNLEYSDVYLV